jgi:predicted dithiol-disulfide oxidoreductase (DUF899 family)
MTANHQVVSREEWIAARKTHLAREKDFTRFRDQLSAERRELPWVEVDKEYVFEGPGGRMTLGDLFHSRSQLIVYHFMLGPDWDEGCKSCSFWADNLQGIDVHLAARDVTLLTISSAPLDRITGFKTRMGWTHEWVSSAGSDFNHDYHVSFSPDELAGGDVYHNYGWTRSSLTERAGISVFCRDADGTVYHTYSCYSRGLDMLNGAYHYLDLVPKGRDEPGPAPHMTWVRFHDSYGV